MAKLWIIIAGLLGAGAVALGAYHAHGLKDALEARYARGENGADPIAENDSRYRENSDENEDGRLDTREIDAHINELMDNALVAVQYQMYHALALLGIGILCACSPAGGSRILPSLAGLAMLAGVAGFSGGLYCIVFDLADLHWAVVPGGGLLMIVGWILLTIAGLFAGSEPAVPQK